MDIAREAYGKAEALEARGYPSAHGVAFSSLGGGSALVRVRAGTLVCLTATVTGTGGAKAYLGGAEVAEFTVPGTSSAIFAAAEDGEVSVTVRVTNTGEITGKEVVQLYYTPPYTDFDISNKIEKPVKSLVAFDKVEAEPGEENAVETTLTFALEDMASYCYTRSNPDGTKGAYVLENGDYMIAYRIDLGNSDDYWLYDESQLTRYVIISKSQTNVEEKVDSVDGTIIEDRTGWKYTANGTDYSEDMFDDDLKDGWTVFTDETPEVKVEVDMASVRTIVGWRMGFIDYSFKQLRDVAVSVDGQKWESQASGDVELALTEGNWRYLQLRSPVECRYIRMTIIPYSWAYNSCEFEAYAPKN